MLQQMWFDWYHIAVKIALKILGKINCNVPNKFLYCSDIFLPDSV